jgi:hypothetical protein
MYDKSQNYHLRRGNRINAGKLEDSVEETSPKNELFGRLPYYKPNIDAPNRVLRVATSFLHLFAKT